MKERRRHPRRPVSWYVRLWLGLGEGRFTRARVVDASLHGMRIAITDDLSPDDLKIGEPARVEVLLPGQDGSFTRVGEVRHVGDQGIGLYLREALPAALLDPSPVDASASPGPAPPPPA